MKQAADPKMSRPKTREVIKNLNLDRHRIIRKNTESSVMNDYRRNLEKGNYIENRIRSVEPEFQFTRFRDFHRLDRGHKRFPDRKTTVPEFEFHDIISQMSDYPQMQRMLGLVTDIQIPVPDKIPNEGTLSVFPYELIFNEETEISVTATAYRLTANGFYARERAGSETDFHNGYVRINSGDFTISQIDTDSAAMQTINQADNQLMRLSENAVRLSSLFLQMSPDEEKVDDEDDEKAIENDPPEGLPVIRSAGIAIVRNSVENYLQKRFITALDLNKKLILSPSANERGTIRNMDMLGISVPLKNINIRVPEQDVLYADDLISGYRLDVAYADEPGKWYSLHYKSDEITCYDENMNSIPVTGIIPDEGFCQIAMTSDEDNKGDLFVSGVMARWTGWSLAIERPGFPIDEAGYGMEKDHIKARSASEEKEHWSRVDTNVRMNVRTSLVPGTLPMLRYGRSYNFKMRYVDIAGNSVAPEFIPDRPGEAIAGNITYRRYEPVGCPPVLFASPPKRGEDIARLVLRSNREIPADKYEASDGSRSNGLSSRIIVPPAVSQLMAEQHGKFDQSFKGDAGEAQKFYELICSRETPPGSGEPLDKIYSAEDFTIKYLPDPVAAGVAFFLAEGYEDTHTQSFKPHTVRFIPLPKSGANDSWLNPRPVTISLLEGEAGSTWDGKSNLNFFLPKGHRAKLRYSCFWDTDNLQRFSGIRHHLSQEKAFSSIRANMENGSHWMVSPSRELELLHAIQQPLSEPELRDADSQRGYLDTPAWIKMKIDVHGQSTGKIDIEATWEDWEDNPLSPLPDKITSREMLDQVQINYKDKTKYIGYQPIKNPEFSVINANASVIRSVPRINLPATSRSNTAMNRQDIPDNLKTMSMIRHFTPAFVLKTWGLMHGFNDTRHRFVNYTPIASSRYGEYFHQDNSAGDGPDLKLAGNPVKVNILSSNRPLTPEVEYIIPTFNWHKTGEKDEQTHVRLGGGLRIYLRRPWFSSGEGEMLAAVLNPGGPASKEIKGDNILYSQWGTDPLHPHPGGKDLYLTGSDFRWYAGQDNGLVYPGMEGIGANVAYFPVKFDAERKLWYADLAISPKNRYFPFVKLMMARYQQHSLRINKSDVCLSPVIETDFIQLLPERKVHLRVERRNGRAVRIAIQISGYRFHEFSNSFEINILSEDIPQPRFGIISNAVPQRRSRGQQSGIGNIRFPDDQSFIATGSFDITSDLRDHPFNVVLLEYEKADPEGNKRLVFSDEFSCMK
jgi:hypothetical protein